MKEFVCQTCGKTFASRKSYKSLTPKFCGSKKKNKTMEEYAIHTDQLHLFDKYDITITNARLLYDKRN